MTGTSAKSGLLERLLPEQRLYIKTGTDDRTRYLRLSPRTQAIALAGCFVVVGWSLTATSALVIGTMTADSAAMQARVIQDAQEARISELSEERDQRAREAAAMRDRFGLALQELSSSQARILAGEQRHAELSTALGLMQDKFRAAIDARDTAAGEADSLSAELADVNGDLSTRTGSEHDLSVTLSSLSDALSDTVEERDTTSTQLTTLEEKLATLEFQARVDADKQERIFTQLEGAVSVTLGPLEKLLRTTGQDVDDLLQKVQSQYSGEGGPFMPTALPLRAEGDPVYERYHTLLTDLDRVHLMYIAATQIPFATPVNQTVRYTSGFGNRRDPINGRVRRHNGQDLAGRPGTPILATADGEVIFAGRQSGYGNLIKIRHSFGYETFYAHLRNIDVKVGDRVARGDVIGGMGNTGRSTGTHLHYEIRIGGTAINPMPYMKAARDVF